MSSSISNSAQACCFTLPYKDVQNITIYLDIYPPSVSALDGTPVVVPAVVYFHGGGLTVGNRQSWFPEWLKRRVTTAGYAFISADYRLMPPSTAYDIVDDIRDLFMYLSNGLNVDLDKKASEADISTFHVDVNRVAVAGSSAGGLCAYLAAMHAIPKPKVVIAMYAMGGDFLTNHYVLPKEHIFFRGREKLDPASFQEYLYPRSLAIPAISDSGLAYDPPTAPIPGYPANPRMLLARLYLQLGVFLDYYVGEHDPSISTKLRHTQASGDDNRVDSMRRLIPGKHLHLFPQFGVTSSWPPTYLMHGEMDTAVPVQESHQMHRLLKKAGVPVTFEVVEGKEHSFDFEPDSERLFESNFNAVLDFLKLHI